MTRFFSEKYSRLVPYTPGEQPKGMKYVKLNTNESPFAPPSSVVEAASEEAGRLNLYCAPEPTSLYEKYAAAVGVKPTQVIATNGSDEILDFAFKAFCDKDHPAIFPDITYGFYEVFAEASGVPYETVPLKDDLRIDPENYIGYMHGNDDDLNAHVTVMRARGICVDGRPIEEVFGKVAKANYLKSLISDMGWDKAQTTYHVLNAARTLAYLREGMVLSKLEGGQWCLANVPEFKDVIEEAVTCCQRSQEMTASDAAESFCRYVHEKTCRELISLQCE